MGNKASIWQQKLAAAADSAAAAFGGSRSKDRIIINQEIVYAEIKNNHQFGLKAAV